MWGTAEGGNSPPLREEAFRAAADRPAAAFAGPCPHIQNCIEPPPKVYDGKFIHYRKWAIPAPQIMQLAQFCWE